jgi:exodeoxyribonuclease VIII
MRDLILTSSPEPIDMDPGVYYGMDWETYSSIDAFSKSMTSYALKSGEHLDHYIHGPRAGSKAKALGSLLDTLMLEPEEFDGRFVVQPETYQTTKTTGRAPNKKTEVIEKPWNNNSSTCKEFKQKVIDSGKELITKADYDRALGMKMSLMSNGESACSITAGKHQVSMVWIDEKTGVKCKGRIDILGDCIDDLKTARDGSPEGFSRDLGKLLYHVQAGAYTDGWRTLTGENKEFRFIVVENSEETRLPAVSLYKLDSVSVVAGLLMFRRALENVARWRKHGVKGYSEFFEPISAPHWMVDREINNAEEDVEI